MFESITERLQSAFARLRSGGTLTEKNVSAGMREIRTALLEADVNYKVVRDFTKAVKERALGREVVQTVNPTQQFIKIVHDELVSLMGASDAEIPYEEVPPTVVMLAGLQGSGKTTTCGKLALKLKREGKTVLMVAADRKRPAAVEQLVTLGKQIDIPVHSEDIAPPRLCRLGVRRARNEGIDVVLLDTAGRLHIDDEMMEELRQVVAKAAPHQKYLVCDATTGQDAVTSASEFNEQIALDGVILTKLDGDARGGAALSVRAVTGRPIKFVGMGEKLDRLEGFHPDRMASRILGMGDVVSLVEKAEAAMDEKQAAEMERRMMKEGLTFEDFLAQMKQLKAMGSMKDLLSMLPGKLGSLQVDESRLGRAEAIVLSMTLQERRLPHIINGSRRSRIAAGSGTTVQEVNALLKQFKQMRKMMKKMGRRGDLAAMFGGN